MTEKTEECLFCYINGCDSQNTTEVEITEDGVKKTVNLCDEHLQGLLIPDEPKEE